MFYEMLQLDCYFLTKHAQVFMKELGITYKHAVPQSMGDCWQFWCCEVPDNVELPKRIKPEEVNPIKYAGFGLSDEKAIELADILGYNYKIEDGCLTGGIKQEQKQATYVKSGVLTGYNKGKATLYFGGIKMTGFASGDPIIITKDK